MKTASKTPSRDALSLLRQRLEASFQEDTAAPGTAWNMPSAGQCAAVAAIVEAEFGGEFLSTVVQGRSHWFNRLVIDGRSVDVDLTGDQFGYAPIRISGVGSLDTGTRVRGHNDLNAETLSRSALLARRAGLSGVARRLSAAARRRAEPVAA